MNAVKEHNDKAAEVFSRRLAMLRKERHMTQAELAAKAGVTRGIVGYYESCNTNPTLETVQKFADVLGISVTDLLEEPGDAEGKPGPVSRLEQQMKQIRRLSAIQQRRLINMIDAFLLTE